MRHLIYNQVGMALMRAGKPLKLGHKELQERVYGNMLKSQSVGTPPQECNASRIALMIMIDECQYEFSGSHMLFVETPELCELLVKAKVRPEGMNMKLPYDSFIVNVPRGLTVDGVELQPFIVSLMTKELRARARRSVIKKAGMDPETCVWDNPWGTKYPEGISVAMNDGRAFIRVTVPFDKLNECLTDDGNLSGQLGNYLDTEHRLDAGDSRKLQLGLRLLCGLCAYLEVKPELLRDGMPGGMAHRDLPDRGMIRGPESFMTVREPEGMRNSQGVCVHLRNWHFRRYPIKTDGTRTAGWVFVNETLVNAKPHTVEAESNSKEH